MEGFAFCLAGRFFETFFVFCGGYFFPFLPFLIDGVYDYFLIEEEDALSSEFSMPDDKFFLYLDGSSSLNISLRSEIEWLCFPPDELELLLLTRSDSKTELEKLLSGFFFLLFASTPY